MRFHATDVGENTAPVAFCNLNVSQLAGMTYATGSLGCMRCRVYGDGEAPVRLIGNQSQRYVC